MFKKFIISVSLVLFVSLAYGESTIKLIVPFSPGGAADITARLIQDSLNQKLQKKVVIEYHAGAGGLIGARLVESADPRETVLLINNLPVLTNDIDRDPKLIPLVDVGKIPAVLVASPASGIKNINQLLAINKSVLISGGTSGVNTFSDLELTNFKQATKKNIINIPYKGQNLILPDLISGNLTISFMFYPVAVTYIESGKLIPLAADSEHRLSKLPNVPTLKENNIKGLEKHSWFVLFSNQTNNKDEIKEIQQIMKQVLSNKSQSAPYTDTGLVIYPKSIIPASDFITTERTTIKSLITVDH